MTQYTIQELNAIASQLFPGKKIECKTREVRVGTHGSISLDVSGVWYDHEKDEGGAIDELTGHYDRSVYKQKAPFNYESPTMPQAKQLYRESKPITGTLGETYFREYRGIVGVLPDTLMFHPKAGKYGKPAVIALISDKDQRFEGVHIIHLKPDGSKSGFKETNGKRNHVKLGKFNKTRVHLCEGIEDGLAVLERCPNLYVWATLGSGNLTNMVFPKSVSEVVVLGDNDDSGRKAMAKAHKVYGEQGYMVITLCPGAPYKDFNEQLLDEKKRVT